MALPPQIHASLSRALSQKGYDTLTEVQSAIIETDHPDADMLVSAQTGSGKTVAFGLAIAPTVLEQAEIFQRAASPLGLVIAPTRELALQVQRELDWLYADAKGVTASCVGGMDPRAERRALERGCHIVVGTPGRLRDHIERGALDMSGLKAVVLDEADEMLDFGFREDLEFILDTAPEDRRTLMFSATVPRQISQLAKRYQKDAQRISTVSEKEQHGDILYRALTVAPSDRENAIINLLRFYEADRAIVFCKTRQSVNRLASRFGNRGFSVVALSGELSQTERTHALQAMRDGRARVCIATDVAARGIDLPGLELVIHADLPTNSDTLLHRSGRTGRAGQKGVCAIIVPHTLKNRAHRLLKGGKIEAEWGSAPSLHDIQGRDRERLFADPVFSETAEGEVSTLAQELLALHGPEKLAEAFVQSWQSGLPAAEDILDAPDSREKKKKKREPFGESVWFSLSAGRKDRAEPRWLLPTICRMGHVTKKEVGSIQIDETETRFEIAAHAADAFIDAVKQAKGGDKSVTIEPAEAPSRERPQRAPKKRSDWQPELDRKTDEDGKTRKNARGRPIGKPRKPRQERTEDERSSKKDKPPKKAKWSAAKKKAAKQKRDAATKRSKHTPRGDEKAGYGTLKRRKKD